MKVSSISNLLARSFLVFIIAWLWISFYVRGFFLILFFSVTVTLAVNFLISLLSKRRSHAKAISRQEREHAASVILQLKFMTQTQAQTLFKKAFPKLSIKSLFHTIPTEQDIVKYVKVSHDTKLILAAESFPPAVAAFARSLDAKIILLDAEAVYTQVLSPTQTFPEITIQLKKKTARKTIREIRQMVFNRTRTKSYVITGAVILLSSLIVRLHIYYIIFATIVFALALSSYFSPQPAKNLLE